MREDTAVERDGGARYVGRLNKDWEIWGPMGGYLSSVALRAAAVASPFARPASFFCQYLGVAGFDDVDIEVTALRSAKTACAQRVHITQHGKPILEATVWSVGDVDGLVHDATATLHPAVPPPSDVPSIEELLTPEELEQGPPFAFWHNFHVKPINFSRSLPGRGSICRPE